VASGTGEGGGDWFSGVVTARRRRSVRIGAVCRRSRGRVDVFGGGGGVVVVDAGCGGVGGGEGAELGVARWGASEGASRVKDEKWGDGRADGTVGVRQWGSGG